mmetsp:Transcript_146858/g.208167  ORF Transcript_146858/g.208167 Transcript_146858/m.208167 type:complete len:473 (-) Transcript_146858:242-1660(-)
MIVDVDDRRWETLLFEGRDHRFDVSPHSVRRPVFALARILDTDLVQLQALRAEEVNLALGPLLQSLQGKFGREDPIWHWQAFCVQQLQGRLVLWAVTCFRVDEVAGMEVVGHPRHPALDASLAAVVLRHDLTRRLEERAPNLRGKLCQAIYVLRTLQRVSWHVVRQAEAKNRRRIEAANQTCLVLCPARLVANAASFLCPNFGVDSTDVAHARALGVIALLGRVTGRHGNPAAALLVELGSQLCDVVLVGCLSPGKGRELGGLRRSLCEFMCQFLHRGCDTEGGIALRVDALPLPIAIHNGGSNLFLQNCQHTSIWVVWDLNVCKGLVGSCFPSSELGTGEEVVQRLCIGGCCSHDCWLAKPEVFSRIVAHLVPSVGCDHGLAQLRICREGDFARSHQLCFDVVQPRSSHAKDVPGLVGDLAVAVRIAVQPPCMEDDGAILGRRKRRCRVSFGTHHQLCKSVASIALAIGLQ